MIDTHAHLSDPRLVDSASRIVEDCDKDNLRAIIEVGYDRATSQSAIAFADKYDKIYAIIGTHPHESKHFTQDDYDYFLAQSSHPKVVAIGEIGLDYYYDLSEREIQSKVFVSQLQLAYKAKLPVVLHIRDAWGDLLQILNDNQHLLVNGILLHCYTGSAEFIKQLQKFDCYYALGGAITFKNANKQDVVRAIPKDRLMLETDCPYMSPVPYRGQTNYPRNVACVAEKIAQLADISLEEVIKTTTQNALRFFKKIALEI